MTTTIDRAWIAAEFAKGIDAERELAAAAQARAKSPPKDFLGVLYHEMAEADERHVQIVEVIATRYGHTPSRNLSGGIAEAVERIKDQVSELGTQPHERVGYDLVAKANAIHWYLAWIPAFRAIGDSQSASELETVVAEETAHRDALQQTLNRLVEAGARGQDS